MTAAQIETLYRLHTNDTGANPFVTQTNWLAILLQPWQVMIANLLQWPRKEQTATISVSGNSISLDADMAQIMGVYYGDSSRTDLLAPIGEEELRYRDPNYRQASDAAPSLYYIKNEFTPGATRARTLLIYPPADTSKTLRVVAIQEPAAISVANIAYTPVAPECLHLHASFWTAGVSMAGRNAEKSAALLALADREWARNNRQAREIVRDALAKQFRGLGIRGPINNNPTLLDPSV